MAYRVQIHKFCKKVKKENILIFKEEFSNLVANYQYIYIQISSSYSVSKIRYGPLTLNIKAFTTSHKITQA